MPAFQPYRGKPAVRNVRGDRGNVGIIRSPVRASILPDRRARGMTSIAFEPIDESYVARDIAHESCRACGSSFERLAATLPIKISP